MERENQIHHRFFRSLPSEIGHHKIQSETIVILFFFINHPLLFCIYSSKVVMKRLSSFQIERAEKQCELKWIYSKRSSAPSTPSINVAMSKDMPDTSNIFSCRQHGVTGRRIREWLRLTVRKGQTSADAYIAGQRSLEIILPWPHFFINQKSQVIYKTI